MERRGAILHRRRHMKVRSVIAGLLLTGAMCFAQTTTPQTPPPGAQGQTGAGATQGATPARPRRGGMDMQGMQQMHQQHLQEAKEQLAKMHQLLDQLKSNVNNMDQKERAYAQANVDLWQMMVSHLDMMVQHMSEMPAGGPRGGMRRHHPGGPGQGMPGSTGPTQPSTPQATPK
jgi:TolA-binding protein